MRLLAACTVAALLSGCVPPKAQPDGSPPPTSTFVTRIYDGHWWVISRSNGHFLHHPDCPQCKRRRILEEPADGQ